MPATQQALVLEQKFGPFVLKERPVPTVGKGQLLVKNEAVALNPVHWKIRKYGVIIEDYPAILGDDVAGVVQEVGEGVTGFAKGDRVFFQGLMTPDRAGYQQYTLAQPETTAKIPDGISFDEVVSIPTGLSAAAVGLYLPAPYGAGLKDPFSADGRGAYAGHPIVIHGGGSSVGQFAIQLAKLSGFTPVITLASSKHTPFLASLGAHHVIDRFTPAASVPSLVSTLTQNKPVSTVYDAASLGETQRLAQELTAPGGATVVTLPPEIQGVDGKTVHHIMGIPLPHNIWLYEKMYAVLEDLVKSGDIKPNRVQILEGGLNGVVKGLALLEEGRVSGTKLVVHPQETIVPA